MRRAAGPMLVAWLFVTLAAVGVTWVAVRPAADQGLADRPPVPQPEVAATPEVSGGPSGADGDTKAGAPENAASRAAPEPSPTGDRAALPKLPTKPPTSAPVSPSVPWSPAPTSTPDRVYRSVEAEGGAATFEYDKSGGVYLVAADPQPGWEFVAYRYDRDWVVVEFQVAGHRTTVHAYLDQGKATVKVVEES